MKFEDFKNSVLEMKAQKKAIEEEINELEDKLDLCALNIDGLTKAREFFQQQAEETQKEIVDVISGLISVALSDIFPEPYSCVIETGIKRNSTEAKLLFVRDDLKLEPEDSVGGGAIDVASFAGRVAFIHLSGDRKILVGDEPFKYVSRDLLDKCPEMMKTLSQLGHQFILISHLPEVIEAADNIIEIEGGCVRC